MFLSSYLLEILIYVSIVVVVFLFFGSYFVTT